jgi:hypothetical protein
VLTRTFLFQDSRFKILDIICVILLHEVFVHCSVLSSVQIQCFSAKHFILIMPKMVVVRFMSSWWKGG